jgi:phospholipid/cholesterol/gamma-HCH transport system ATP-binding protein
MKGHGLINVSGLNSFYGNHQVLYDIEFSIPRHQVTVIMGVSGCGKSTLLRHLIGLKPSYPGQLFLEHQDMARLGARDWDCYRRRIGVLFQSSALFNSLTVAENVAVPLRVHSRLPQETIRIICQIKLHLVGLSAFGDYMPSQLSGGMRKRAGLARALAMDPEILFVDEPSSGLDPITAAGMDDLLLALRDALGVTIIVVTHELESAIRIANQMLVLDKGRLLVVGTPQEVQNSNNERVMQFLRRNADQQHTDTETYLAGLVGRRTKP